MTKTEPTYTPGPWRIRLNPKGGWNIGDANGNVSFAVVRDHWANSRADACLIAAAPDLLLAAQLALEEIEYHEENSLAAQQLGPSPTIKRLRAAIAKAIGQEIK